MISNIPPIWEVLVLADIIMRGAYCAPYCSTQTDVCLEMHTMVLSYCRLTTDCRPLQLDCKVLQSSCS